MPIKISYSTDSYFEFILIFNKKPLDRISRIFMFFFIPSFLKKLEIHNPPVAEIKG